MSVRILSLLTGALALAACGGGEARQPVAGPEIEIGLASSLPIVLPEADDIADLLAGDGEEHWALAVLRGHGELRPLDGLADDQGQFPLAQDALLVMAQPWPLSPQENVALDDWVRAGGRVLLFVDPLLTFDSRFAIGDRRRPQDVAMLSPILTRWGLRLLRDQEASPELRIVEIGDIRVPIALPGQFEPLDGSTCRIEASGLLADCRIGKGRVVAIADAALLESRDDEPEALREAALSALLDRVSR